MQYFNFSDRPTEAKLTAFEAIYPGLPVHSVLAFLAFQQTYRQMQTTYDALCAQYGLSESKFIILMFLYHVQPEGLSTTAIAEKLGATKATASKLIQHLIAQEFVTKTPSPTDKRASTITLTRKGDTVLQAFLPQNFHAAEAVFAAFEPEELQTFQRLLQKITTGTQKLTHEMERISHE